MGAYQKINPELMRKKASDAVASCGGGGGGNDLFYSIPYTQPNEKKLIRFLPPYEGGPADVGLEVHVHFGFIGQDGKRRIYVCTKLKYGHCPICTESERLSTVDPDMAKNIKAAKQYLYNILDENMQEKVLTAKPKQHLYIQAETNDSLAEGKDPFDLDTGTVYKYTRTKNDPYFTIRPAQENTPLPPEVKSSLKFRKLHELYIENTPEELATVLQGGDPNFAKLEARKSQSKSNSAAGPVATNTLNNPHANVQSQPYTPQPQVAPSAAPALAYVPQPRAAQQAYSAQPPATVTHDVQPPAHIPVVNAQAQNLRALLKS